MASSLKPSSKSLCDSRHFHVRRGGIFEDEDPDFEDGDPAFGDV
jgi:hypothetical protein